MLGITAAIGGVAQLGQSIFGMVQGRRAMREAQKVKKPKFEVQKEFEQNRALALNRYNAGNPYIAQATNNLNQQSAAATIAAQQTAGDSAAALEAITGVSNNAMNANANLMAQADEMRNARFEDVVKANESLAGDKNRVTNQEYSDYMLAQQKEMAGKQGIMDAIGGISNMAGDIFSIGATEGTDVFKDIFKFRKGGKAGTPSIMGAGAGFGF
tara:strand:+ start:400 stop:1038 length:639 start_codon:yes stop_codon:yes gene_type:complete